MKLNKSLLLITNGEVPNSLLHLTKLYIAVNKLVTL